MKTLCKLIDRYDPAGLTFLLVISALVGLCAAVVIGDTYHDVFCCLH